MEKRGQQAGQLPTRLGVIPLRIAPSCFTAGIKDQDIGISAVRAGAV